MVDIAIIGTGIMGSCLARELSKYNLNVVLLDKENDVSDGTTKANSAIVHAGYDAKEGTLMAKYNVLGNAMYEDLCKEVDAPFKRVGSYVLAFDENDKKHIEQLYNRGLANGVPLMKLMTRDEVLEREPNINPNIVGALYAGSAGITGPWELAIKLIENAMENGVDLKLNSEVVGIEKKDGHFNIKIKDKEDIQAKIVVNAAGVHADEINDMIGSQNKFKIHPRVGEYYLLDKVQGKLTNSVIFQCPNEMGKGILVSITAHGNIIVGPTASDIDDKSFVGNTLEGLDTIRAQAVKSIANINFRDNIRNFAGVRAEADTGDFILGESDVEGVYNMAGTKSPGLTSAPAMALDLANMIVEKLNAEKKIDFKQNRKRIHFIDLSPEEKAEAIKKDSRYGRIICRCENITEGEIVDAIHRKCGGTTLNGIKRRCRPGSGRCQGGFCGPRVQEILSRELNIQLEDVLQEQLGSYILTGETKK